MISTRINFKPLQKLAKEYSTLLIAECDQSKNISPATKNALTACKKIGKEIRILVTGKDCSNASRTLSKASGIKGVLEAEDKLFDHGLTENITLLVQKLQENYKFTHIVAPSTSFARSLLPRIAGNLDVSPISDITSIKSPNTFTRCIYSGSAVSTLTNKDEINILTIRTISFEEDTLTGGNVEIQKIPKEYVLLKAHPKEVLSTEMLKFDRPPLDTAKVVVSGGKGVRSKENFKLIYELARKFNAAVGATRAVVDAGFVPSDLQIGQSGKIVAPRLYFAIGISGAVQHVVGMRDSKVVVAINKDPNAPIFKYADFGLVGDLFKFVPELIKKI